MRTALYVLLALAAPALAGQTVYTWKDEKGVTHFSDQPVAGAEKMELSSGSSKGASEPAPSYSPPASSEPQPKAGPPYSRFVVESPQQDQAFINSGGNVTVQLAATPPISGFHTVVLYLDGSPVQGYEGSMSHEFPALPRGTHTVKAVVSEGGKKLQETPAVTFHVRQESVAKPPVGPTMRPNPPKRTAGNKVTTTQPTYQALNGAPAKIDPSTNKPVTKKPATPVGPKAGN